MNNNHPSFDSWVRDQQKAVEDALCAWVPKDTPGRLGEVMRYAVLDGGKRLRPLLVLGVADELGGSLVAAMRAAAAVEVVHAYSLVHDDLPCMDNDVLRRGKPTCHVRYGEAQAMLAGDAMQALAFEILTGDDTIPAATQAGMCGLLARCSGHSGMAGGQAIDLQSVGKQLTEGELREMHRMKTGALLWCSIQLGVLTASNLDPVRRECLDQFGKAIGLAFQVVDDILDCTADSVTLGKTAGKDALNHKPTYVQLMGLERATGFASELLDQAMAALAKGHMNPDGRLANLAKMVVSRRS